MNSNELNIEESSSPYIGSCSTFLMKHSSELIVGHNLDDRYEVHGSVTINKRGVFKRGITWKELNSNEEETSQKPEWVSKYGSVSFNTRGRDFADGGMNEKGLSIWEMSLPGTEFVCEQSKPTLFMMLWMQYQLDNHESVQQVIQSASDFVLDGWGWHFFAADRTGNCASIEFIAGELVVHTGNKMPVPVLCNSQYSCELRELRGQEGRNSKEASAAEPKKDLRFGEAAKLIRGYDPMVIEDTIKYSWKILKKIAIDGYNQWQILVDLKNLHVYLRTKQCRKLRHFNLNSFDLSCNSPVKMIDIHADLSGDISDDFVDYTLEMNRDFVKRDIEGIISNFPQYEERLHSNGITKNLLIDRLANYTVSTVCRHG